ncbi:MAG: ABC transporter substrate-binding protein [Bacillota bacterium]
MRSWSRIFPVWIVAVALAFFIAGCGGQSGAPEKVEPYKIGAVIEVSGPAASLGVPQKNTLEMLAADLNARGGINGHPVQLIILDNKTNETEAVLAAKRLIDQDKVLVILGGSTSGTSLAMVDTVQKSGVPMISHAASAKIVEPVADRHWVFKTAQSDILVANKIAAYLKSKGITDVAFMSMNNAFGDSGRGNFMTAAAAHGLKVVVDERFEVDDKDMTMQLTKVKGSSAQALVVWAIPPSASIVTKNFRDLKMAIPLIHTHGVGNQTFLDLAGGAADGIIAPMGKLLVAEQLPDTDPQKALLLEYLQAYQAKYGERPSTFGGHGWDAFQLAVKAIETAGADRAAIRDALENTAGFVGISGVFNMSAQDHNGLGEDSMVLVEVTDGKWSLLNP